MCKIAKAQTGNRMDAYRLNDLHVTLDKAGAARYTKASYPIRYGRYSEVRTSDYLFQFNLAGEIKYIQGINRNWLHPAEWLKRTVANDWVYYSIAGYHRIRDTLGEYYLPCLPYPTNSIWTYNPFGESMILGALEAWSQLQSCLQRSPGTGLPSHVRNFLKLAAGNDARRLHRKAARLHVILGSEVSVLPPDTRHVDYEIIPLIIADGCLYRCSFCCIKSNRSYKRRSERNILQQIKLLRQLYAADLKNYNALFLGNHDGLAAGGKLISLAAEEAYNAFGFANANVKNPSMFIFGSVDSLLNAETSLFEALNRMPFHSYINIGLESADAATLSAINKPVELNKIENAFQTMLDINHSYLNIEITANFLIGDRLAPGHYRALIDLVRSRLDRFYSKGGIYLSPLYSSQNNRQLLRTFFEIKNQSRLPTHLYLIQRL